MLMLQRRVHGDVKPSNIMWGPDGVARLSDMGLMVEEEASHIGCTVTSPPVDLLCPLPNGQLTWTDPQQARRFITALLDVFNAGLVPLDLLGLRPDHLKYEVVVQELAEAGLDAQQQHQAASQVLYERLWTTVQQQQWPVLLLPVLEYNPELYQVLTNMLCSAGDRWSAAQLLQHSSFDGECSRLAWVLALHADGCFFIAGGVFFLCAADELARKQALLFVQCDSAYTALQAT